MSIWKNGKLVAGGRQVTPLLSFMWADHILDDISWLRADAFSWQSGAVYQAVYQHLADDIDGKSLQSETVGGTTIQFYLADDGHKICPESEMSNVAAIYAATSVAWYYIIDTVNERFKLPRTKFGFTGLRNTVGNYVAPGIPNLTGEFYNRYNNTNVLFGPQTTTSGVFKFRATGSSQVLTNSSSTLSDAGVMGIDASQASSVYNDSTTVQPPATQMYLYFYVGAFTQTATQNTAGLNAELFNDKVDKGHQVIEFQAPTADNNYTWYRKYADGWVEMGGKAITNGSNPTLITLPVELAEANYIPFIQGRTATDGYSNATWQVMPVNTATSTQTATGFYAQASITGYNLTFGWEVRGMAAA